MLRHGETPILNPSKSLLNKVRQYATRGGGIYRMNVSSFDFYCFTPFKDGNGRGDFCGGWDSQYGIGSTPFTHVYCTQNGKFYTKEVAIQKFK